MPLNEEAKRKPGVNVDESVPVEFGDGQEWYLPRPIVDIFAIFEGDTVTEAVANSFGEEFAAKVKACRDSDVATFFPIVARLAADLLRRNYELTDAELGSILRYRPGDASAEWMGAVLSVAGGNGAPKASGDGSGSSSPT